ILEEWANDSDQPFNVCIARRSIVFFNQGYGFRNGQPITVDTKHLVFSITKALSGCLLMMFIDQGSSAWTIQWEKYYPSLMTKVLKHLSLFITSLRTLLIWMVTLPIRGTTLSMHTVRLTHI
ncbi:TPA: hypothetical protein EYN65_06130, partial [Candidatus Poribacteria bacterium]|nr:hypothetical protein [Candidatus Poribacteria bacterium]